MKKPNLGIKQKLKVDQNLENRCIFFRFEWQSPIISVPYSLENTQKVQHIDTTLSTVLLKATGYKTLTSSRGRAVHVEMATASCLYLSRERDVGIPLCVQIE